jgi:hypothetical protein
LERLVWRAVYGNRRRIQGEHGKALLRRRGEFVERSFAHAYETGGQNVFDVHTKSQGEGLDGTKYKDW